MPKEPDEKVNRADPKEEKIEELEWALALALSLFGTYAVFVYVSDYLENKFLIFLAVAIAFAALIGIASFLRKSLSSLITFFFLGAISFSIYRVFEWFS